MKKIFATIILGVISMVSFAQYNTGWTKSTTYDDMTGEPNDIMYYFDNHDRITAYYTLKDSVFYVISYCPLAKEFDIAWDACIDNNGVPHSPRNVDVQISYNGDIREDNILMVWPTLESAASTVTSFTAISKIEPECLKKWKFITLKYYDVCWFDEVTNKISLIGFTHAYNK